MNDLREHLRRTDPVAHEPTLSEDEAAALRQRVLSFTPHSPRRRLPGRRLTVATALVILGVVASGFIRIAMSRPPAQPRVSRFLGRTLDAGESVRRVYFQTPSGMRVVWLFEPESGEGTLP
jgi:hypothetical protein